MTKEQEAAMRTLAAALGVKVPERPVIPKELAGRAIEEIAAAMAGNVTLRDDNGNFTFDVQHGVGSHADPSMFVPGTSKVPKDSALATLQALLTGKNTEPPQPSAGHVSSEPSAEMQEAIDKAVERALAKHGISTDGTTNTDEE